MFGQKVLYRALPQISGSATTNCLLSPDAVKFIDHSFDSIVAEYTAQLCISIAVHSRITHDLWVYYVY
jgi:hypothetical protein